MRLGIVGGPDRAEQIYRRLADQASVELEFHTGDQSGHGGATLDSLIERSDVVVVVTNVNSHAAVWRARKHALRLGRRCLLVNHLGVARLNVLLKELATQGPVARSALR
jgi:hypothetical protein